MPRAAQAYLARGELRLHGVELIAQLGLGEYQVQLHEYAEIARNVVRVLGAVGGELGEDALDLRFFPRAQLAQLVVCLHGGHRLDEERAPELDTSCTSPGTAFLNSAFTGTTKRSERVVMMGSCSALA